MRDAGHGGPAAPAERPLERRGRRIVDDVGLARAPAKVLALHAEPRTEQRAVLLAAHRAVAMREPQIRRPDLEAHGAAEAGAGEDVADDVAHAIGLASSLSSRWRPGVAAITNERVASVQGAPLSRSVTVAPASAATRQPAAVCTGGSNRCVASATWTIPAMRPIAR